MHTPNRFDESYQTRKRSRESNISVFEAQKPNPGCVKAQQATQGSRQLFSIRRVDATSLNAGAIQREKTTSGRFLKDPDGKAFSEADLEGGKTFEFYKFSIEEGDTKEYGQT